MLHVAVVEDDQKYTAQIVGYLDRFAQENQVDIQSHCFQDGMQIVTKYKPVYDIIFLDIDMPLLDGMAAAEQIRQMDSAVLLIFITNLAQYAIRGYDVDALDYVLKPVGYATFAMKLQKACRILSGREMRYVLLADGQESKKVPMSNVRYIEVANHQLLYHTTEGDFFQFGTLRRLEEELGSSFARCNRCYLVNLSHVDGVKQDCVLLGTESLKISRARKRQFMQMLTDYCRFGGR